uniref:Uncharacterized protein MANES_01G046100 n=1 Tax=Rhizophora mucronata TaxID=61149 RepID=A0A2P2PJ09_RHIMU
MEEARTKAVCAEEALTLLNCVTRLPYDQDKCVLLLNALRDCVVNKKVKKFTLVDEDQKEANLASKKP